MSVSTNSKRLGTPTARVWLRWEVVSLLIIIGCHLPMLLAYFYRLALYEHYQFFPFALGAVGWLVSRRIDLTSFGWTRFGVICVAIDLVLLTGSCLLMSPWLAAVGMAILILGISFSGIEQPNRYPFEIALLFLTVVRPPFGADIQLIQKLQLLTSRCASGLLDRMGVLHVQTGNLIHLPDKQLFVEEACSGVQSLFTLLFLAAAITAWHRRSPLHAILLMVIAPMCSIPMNIVRVLTVAVAWDSLAVDLTYGLMHDVVGYVLLTIATAFLISGDRFIAFLGAPISTKWAIENGRTWANPFVDFWNRLWDSLRQSGTRLSRRRNVMMKFATVGCLCLLGFQCLSLFASHRNSPVTPKEPTIGPPEVLGEFEYQSEDWKTRSSASSFGKYSRIWNYKSSGLRCTFSCDYPFPSWHALEVCYAGQGWTFGEKSVSDDEWPMVRFQLSKPTGENAYLVYSFFESDGTTVRPPTITDPSAAFQDRIMKPGNWLVTERMIYQSQLFIRSSSQLSEDDIGALDNHHREMRELMRLSLADTEATP